MARLLLVAPGCDPTDVGESWVGFQWVSRLSERHDVTLLTYHKRDRKPPSASLPGVRVIEWPDVPLVGRNERLDSLLKPGYPAFYVRARRWVRQALRDGERFDLAHQVVPVAMRYPCPASGLGLPVVIGPVGGSLPTPPGFAGDEGTSPWYQRLRAFDSARLRRDPLLRRTFDTAACVLVIAPYAQAALGARKVRRFVVMSETGLEALPVLDGARPASEATRLLYVGRVIRSKGLRDVIRALGRLKPDVAVTLDVVGDGFDAGACKELVAELGLSDVVTFHGKRPRAEVDAFYRAADVFVFPSYRESGGNVTFEAMGFGLPLIVSDVGGPGAVVDETCGIRIHPEDPESFADGIAEAITQLAGDPDLRRRLGTGARRQVEAIGMWDGKIARAEELYADILGRPLH
ncbi:MAG: glycosyltransferase family 4 protein [Acidimicrobiales bacterium]